MASQLPPVPQQIGFYQDLIARQPETMVLKERVLSVTGDSFDITLANGQPILHVEGKVFSLGGRKMVYDMAGKHLFTIMRELMHMHNTFVLVDPQDKKFFELQKHFQLFGSRSVATFTTASTGKAESLTMKSHEIGKSSEIIDDSTGQTVARINRQIFNSRQLIFGQQTYMVEVAPGVDMAMIAALCICLDEQKEK